MSSKLFVLNNDRTRRMALAEVAAVGLDDGMCVELKKYRSKRSAAQNALYWGVWLPYISSVTGYTVDELHDKFRIKFLGTRIVQVRGDVYHVPKSTTKLNTKEFSEYLNEIDRMMSTEVGVTLPHPEDVYYEALGYTHVERQQDSAPENP